jgi:hypothetical protein
MKVAFIEANFPELTVPKARQSGKGEGGTMKVAIRNAVSKLLKNRALAHKRISVISMTCTITEKTEVDPDHDRPLLVWPEGPYPTLYPKKGM